MAWPGAYTIAQFWKSPAPVTSHETDLDRRPCEQALPHRSPAASGSHLAGSDHGRRGRTVAPSATHVALGSGPAGNRQRRESRGDDLGAKRCLLGSPAGDCDRHHWPKWVREIDAPENL